MSQTIRIRFVLRSSVDEGRSWSNEVKVPQTRVPSVVLARDGSSKEIAGKRHLRHATLFGPAPNGRHFCIDGENVRGLLQKTDKVYELPVEGWSFKLDDFGVDSEDPKTFDKPIKIGETWDQQGFAGRTPSAGIGWNSSCQRT